MSTFKQCATAAITTIGIVAAFFYGAPVANAAPDDTGPAPIESADGPRDVGAKIDDASGPRSTVTDKTPNGAGVLPQTGSGPRDVGAKIEPATAPRPVGKPVRAK